MSDQSADIGKDLKLYRVRVSKTIFVVSDDLSDIGGAAAHAMAEDDGDAWSSIATEVESLGLVKQFADTLPHSTDRDFARLNLTIADFFRIQGEQKIAEAERAIAASIAEGLLVLGDEPYFEKVKDFAKRQGLILPFFNGLSALVGRGVFFGRPSAVVLWKDFAPASFAFTIRDRQSKDGLMSGGLIYHGPHDGWGNGSAPSFSVSLSASHEPRWEVHT